MVSGAGITVSTHGYNGNITDWVIPMGDRIPRYAGFPGTNSSVYAVSVTQSGGQYAVTPSFQDGVDPLVSDSGEVVVALDWSDLDGWFQPYTAEIAAQVAAALLTNNLLAELAGRPLAELPLHLVGHSRGASMMAEVARVLGAQSC